MSGLVPARNHERLAGGSLSASASMPRPRPILVQRSECVQRPVAEVRAAEIPWRAYTSQILVRTLVRLRSHVQRPRRLVSQATRASSRGSLCLLRDVELRRCLHHVSAEHGWGVDEPNSEHPQLHVPFRILDSKVEIRLGLFPR